MPERTIVTADWIAAIRTQYGLDTRTPQAAGEAWGTHSLVAGAITALGHALDRVEALEKTIQAMTEDAAVEAATGALVPHVGFVLYGNQIDRSNVVRSILTAARDAASAGTNAEDTTDA